MTVNPIFEELMKQFSGNFGATPEHKPHTVNVPVTTFEVQLQDMMNRHEYRTGWVPDDVLVNAAQHILEKHGEELERACVALLEGRKLP